MTVRPQGKDDLEKSSQSQAVTLRFLWAHSIRKVGLSRVKLAVDWKQPQSTRSQGFSLKEILLFHNVGLFRALPGQGDTGRDSGPSDGLGSPRPLA